MGHGNREQRGGSGLLGDALQGRMLSLSPQNPNFGNSEYPKKGIAIRDMRIALLKDNPKQVENHIR